jgi:hypothetical protein
MFFSRTNSAASKQGLAAELKHGFDLARLPREEGDHQRISVIISLTLSVCHLRAKFTLGEIEVVPAFEKGGRSRFTLPSDYRPRTCSSCRVCSLAFGVDVPSGASVLPRPTRRRLPPRARGHIGFGVNALIIRSEDIKLDESNRKDDTTRVAFTGVMVQWGTESNLCKGAPTSQRFQRRLRLSWNPLVG